MRARIAGEAPDTLCSSSSTRRFLRWAVVLNTHTFLAKRRALVGRARHRGRKDRSRRRCHVSRAWSGRWIPDYRPET